MTDTATRPADRPRARRDPAARPRPLRRGGDRGLEREHEARGGLEVGRLSGCCGPSVSTARSPSTARRSTSRTRRLLRRRLLLRRLRARTASSSTTPPTREGLPDAALLASLGCGNPDRGRRAARGRDRPRPRLGRRHRRPPLRASRRPDRPRDRRRHDRRDAQPRPAQRRRGRRRQRRVPQGHDRGAPARRRERRRRHQQLRHQPRLGQAGRLRARSPACSGPAGGWASATSSRTTC